MSSPLDGMPLLSMLPLVFGFVTNVLVLIWTAQLFVRARRAARRAPELDDSYVDRFSWAFLVPALNEEVTIRDCVERLFALEVGQRRIVVVDDGSDDATSEILAELDHPDLIVLRRDLPDARRGKADSLNAGYRLLRTAIDEDDANRVIVTIVDADGRLDQQMARAAAAHFVDPEVGGVQLLVRIYNRQRLLTWMQDVEFSVFGRLFQAGRNRSGTAGMGGSGQLNRLAALDDVADEYGPWRDRLTEDQDIGLRLLAAGWTCRQELRASVHQQGLSSPRALARQRTRWSQGNLQALSLLGAVAHAPFGRWARMEVLALLLMPLWQGLVGLALIVSVTRALSGSALLASQGSAWWLLPIYLLAFGGSVFGCVAARSSLGARGWVRGILVAHVYSFYTWLLWPVLLRATLRQLTDRRDWDKTGREPVTDGR